MSHVSQEMIKFLETSEGYEIFRQGLAKNFAEENLVFWKKIEDLHAIINQVEVATAAEEIYRTHLARRCPSPITVRYEQQKKDIVAICEKGLWTSSMYDVLQENCLAALEEFWTLHKEALLNHSPTTPARSSKKTKKEKAIKPKSLKLAEPPTPLSVSDAILAHISTEEGYNHFLQALEKLHAQENLLFWKKVEILHQTNDVPGVAEAIYKEHLARRCLMPITVRYEGYKKEVVALCEKGEWSKTMYDVLQSNCFQTFEEYWVNYSPRKKERTATSPRPPERGVDKKSNHEAQRGSDKKDNSKGEKKFGGSGGPTMMEEIHTLEGFENFRSCLAKYYAEDYLLFWEKVENLHNELEVPQAAEAIYRTHLARRCPSPITVKYEQKKKDVVALCEKGEWSSTMFDGIQKDCVAAMQEYWVNYNSEIMKNRAGRATASAGKEKRGSMPKMKAENSKHATERPRASTLVEGVPTRLGPIVPKKAYSHAWLLKIYNSAENQNFIAIIDQHGNALDFDNAVGPLQGTYLKYKNGSTTAVSLSFIKTWMDGTVQREKEICNFQVSLIDGYRLTALKPEDPYTVDSIQRCVKAVVIVKVQKTEYVLMASSRMNLSRYKTSF